jgi:hypothetical protein
LIYILLQYAYRTFSNIRKIISFLCNVFPSAASKSTYNLKILLMKTQAKLRTATFLFLLICCGQSFAQSAKTVPVSNFNAVSVSSGIDLYLKQGSSETLKFVGDQELLGKVMVEKDGDGIRIRYKDNSSWSNLFNNKSLKVYVTCRNLTSVSASGGSDVYTERPLKTGKLNLHASGGSDLKMDVSCTDVEIQASGGSDVYLKGKAVNMALHTSGGSDVNAFDFNVDNARVEASGGSDANIYVNKALEANASGGSDVHYKGNASYRKTSSSKSGSVTRID